MTVHFSYTLETKREVNTVLGREDIGIDLGTSSVLVYVKGRGVVLREPAMVAVDRNTRNIIAVGEEAKRMQGRTPGHIVAVRPLREGSISDFDITERMLRYFIHKVCGKRMLFRPRAVVCVPSGVPEMEKRSVLDAMLDAGARRTQMIDAAVAGALGAGLEVSDTYGHMIIDIGGGITDISIVSLERATVRRSVKLAGDHFDDAIIRYLRRKHNLMIGERTAEELKLTIGATVRRTERLHMDVTGRNLVTGLPKTIRIYSEELHEAMEELVAALVEEVHGVIEKAPPELAADIVDHGIKMIGSGSQLFGLAEALTMSLKIPCTLADDPQSCVANGIGRVMESEEEFGRTLLDFRQPKGYMSA